MSPTLQAESEKLARSWMRHEASWLRDYLVAGVEDPRVNIQSILSRHFLIRAVGGEALAPLMDEECRFSAVVNWLLGVAGSCTQAEDLELVLFALNGGADNAEGIEIPGWVSRTFASLPKTLGHLQIQNYLRTFLQGTDFLEARPRADQASLNTFCDVWRRALASPLGEAGTPDFLPQSARISVLEPACGSANDYRFLAACGLAPLIDYTGLDLCVKNIDNARALFPGVRFETGNVFEIPAADDAFDYCIVHDLFEHLSPEGIATAASEICRVTSRGMCVGFFQMDEIPEHAVRPVEEYHWNLLSMARMRELFVAHGFQAQVLHLGTFLRQKTGCDRFHNPNAYTFWCRSGSVQPPGQA